MKVYAIVWEDGCYSDTVVLPGDHYYPNREAAEKAASLAYDAALRDRWQHRQAVDLFSASGYVGQVSDYRKDVPEPSAEAIDDLRQETDLRFYVCALTPPTSEPARCPHEAERWS